MLMAASLRPAIHLKKMQCWCLQELNDPRDKNHHVGKQGDSGSDSYKCIPHALDPGHMELGYGGVMFDLKQGSCSEDSGQQKQQCDYYNKNPLYHIQMQYDTSNNDGYGKKNLKGQARIGGKYFP